MLYHDRTDLVITMELILLKVKKVKNARIAFLTMDLSFKILYGVDNSMS